MQERLPIIGADVRPRIVRYYLKLSTMRSTASVLFQAASSIPENVGHLFTYVYTCSECMYISDVYEIDVCFLNTENFFFHFFSFFSVK